MLNTTAHQLTTRQPPYVAHIKPTSTTGETHSTHTKQVQQKLNINPVQVPKTTGHSNHTVQGQFNAISKASPTHSPKPIHTPTPYTPTQNNSPTPIQHQFKACTCRLTWGTNNWLVPHPQKQDKGKCYNHVYHSWRRNMWSPRIGFGSRAICKYSRHYSLCKTNTSRTIKYGCWPYTISNYTGP